ncbi:MAG TPA: GDSL-type esterase/lipase family protein [Candidatus Microsaccharimonas sp.]|jgi:lysophospholipase L1-like esterase
MNINSSAERIMVFGDSLSWGYEPGSKHQRFASDVRWPGKLQQLLGDDYEIIEENLNSRGIENGDPRPGKEGRRALDYIEACLDSQDPLDRVIVLLGTNELKNEMGMSADAVGESMEKLLSIILTRPSQFRGTTPKVTLLSPPIINEDTEYCRTGDKYLGATEKSKQLVEVCEILATKLGVGFVALNSINVGVDGIHIDADEHAKVAELVYRSLNAA